MSICLVKEKFEDTKGVIRSGKSKDRQYNGQKKKEKQRLTKQYTENQATYTPLKTGSELWCTGNVKKLNIVI